MTSTIEGNNSVGSLLKPLLKFGGGNLFSPAMTSTIEGNNSVGSLLKPLLKKVTPVVGSRMLWNLWRLLVYAPLLQLITLCYYDDTMVALWWYPFYTQADFRKPDNGSLAFGNLWSSRSLFHLRLGSAASSVGIWINSSLRHRFTTSTTAHKLSPPPTHPPHCNLLAVAVICQSSELRLTRATALPSSVVSPPFVLSSSLRLERLPLISELLSFVFLFCSK
jgi:hypothetical protein